MKRVILIFALILCSLVVNIGFCKESGPKVIKVKGMYIGMDINDALRRCKKRVLEFTYTHIVIDSNK